MASTPTKRDPRLGQIFQDRYRIDSVLGKGGMGTVYRATQLTMERDVAIKVVQSRSRFKGGSEELIKRFELEMKATAAIEHQNTVRVYEYGHTKKGELYLVMELLAGWSLGDIITSHAPMDPDRVVRIALGIARALSAAHAAGIIHRDLKPGNIMLIDRADEKDFVKVIDFGLARVNEQDQSAKLTASDLRVGTPMCMAPEYIKTASIDHRADLYALGVIMFELVTGETPYKGTPYEVLVAHVQDDTPRPSDRIDGLPGWLDDLVFKLLQKEPEDRYETAGELIDVLTRAAAGESVSVPAPKGSLARSTMLGGLLVASLVVVVLVHAIALVIAGFVRTQFEDQLGAVPPNESLVAVLTEPTVAVIGVRGVGEDELVSRVASDLHREIVLDLGQETGMTVAPPTAVSERDGKRVFNRPVTATLEGTVKRSDQQLSVTVQLLDARDGSAMWAGTYDLPTRKPGSIQLGHDIADEVAVRLKRQE